MASLAYCYHIALMEVSRSLCLWHLYAPDAMNNFYEEHSSHKKMCVLLIKALSSVLF